MSDNKTQLLNWQRIVQPSAVVFRLPDALHGVDGFALDGSQLVGQGALGWPLTRSVCETWLKIAPPETPPEKETP